MSKPKRHLFICTNVRPEGHPRGAGCGAVGGRELMMKFSEEFMKQNLFGEVALTGTQCMGPCGGGPVAVVYPEGIWYQKITPQDVSEIVEKHLMEGKPVQRLVMEL